MGKDGDGNVRDVCREEGVCGKERDGEGNERGVHGGGRKVIINIDFTSSML